MALQHEQERSTNLEIQLESVSEQLLQAKQALLDEQLRSDMLTGQRESLERTLRQAQEALSEELPNSPAPSWPWAAVHALGASSVGKSHSSAGFYNQQHIEESHRRGTPANAATPNQAHRRRLGGESEAGRTPAALAESSPADSSGSAPASNSSPTRQKMAQELEDARKWLADALEQSNALQKQEQGLKVKLWTSLQCHLPIPEHDQLTIL